MKNNILEFNKIKEFFKDLKFEEASHSYSVGSTSLKSVSHFISDFYEKFDADKMSELVATKRGLSKEEVLKEWEDIKNKACELGTKVHLFGEKYMFDRTLVPSNGYEEAIKSWISTIPEHIVPAIMELQMYNKEWKIAGTADILLYDTENQAFVLRDYKSNRDLFNNFQGKKLLYPFDDMLDCPFSKYEIQLSMYQLLFEQTGFKISSRALVWVKPNGTYEVIKTRDLRDKILKLYESNRDNTENTVTLL